MRNIRRAGAVALLLLGAFAVVQSGALAQAGSVTIEVRCQPNPETIRISNRTGGQLTIQRIESSFGPKAPGEPIDVPARLPAMSTIGNDVTVSFENGPGAAGNVLLTTEIFDKTNLANERVIVATDRGTFEVPCGSGSNSQTFSVGASASPGPAIPNIRPPTAGEVGGAVGTFTAPAQATAAAAAATAGNATAPFGAAAGTVTAPLQATVGSAAQTGSSNLATAVPPGALATPQVPNVFGNPQQQQQPTATAQSPVPRPGGGTVTGIVFNDLNENGLLDGGEPGIGGVSVFLRSPGPDGTAGTADDTVVAATSTAGDGRYSFASVASGGFVVVETDPPGATSTTNNTVAVTVANNTVTVTFGDKLPVTAGAAPAQAGGLPPIVLLPIGLALLALGLALGRRSATAPAR